MRYYAVRVVPHTRHHAFLSSSLCGILRFEVRRVLVTVRHNTIRHTAVRVVTYTRHYADSAVLATNTSAARVI